MPDRIIKESSCLSETLNSLTDFEERFWWRLIVNCDDYGRFDARPKILKGRLFPLADGKTHTDMQNALTKLASVGLVELYEVDGRPFLQVVTWEKCQRIRAKRSKFPPLPSSANICRQVSSNVPVIQSNPCENPNPNAETDATGAPARNPAIAAVMTAYMDKINPTPSATSLEELKTFAEEMGAECCLRAFDIALDSKKTSWSYIRAILRAKHAQGVRCLADWDKLDKKWDEEKQDPFSASTKRLVDRGLVKIGTRNLDDDEKAAIARLMASDEGGE